MVELFRFIKFNNGEKRDSIKFKTLGVKKEKIMKGKCKNER